jgi:hypothetical protein
VAEFFGMAKLVFGMNQSLDGYVDHLEMRPALAKRRLPCLERQRNCCAEAPHALLQLDAWSD